VAGGSEIWSFDTEDEDNRSTNVGGGIAVSGDRVYATTGRGELVAIDATNGTPVWRQMIGTAARSSPTVADDKIFFCTIDSKVQAHAVADGKKLWAYQGTTADTSVLGLPAPAYEGGLVVAGLGSGELVALRAASGTVAWGDSLSAARGRNSLADLSAVRGRPAIRDGRVYATSLGGLLVSLDLRTGRRLWEREVTSSESPWAAGDWLFIVSSEGQVAAIARQNGAAAWVTQLDRYEDMEASKGPILWVGPVLAGDRLVVVGTNSMALSLSPYTGEVLGQQALPGRAAVAPSVAGGTLFLLTDDATLSAFR
jgi:outer membrane protein assembly factor BamB